MNFTRRDFGRFALAALPAVRAFGAINSKINGVQIGAITYSFNTIANDPPSIIQAYVEDGLGECELMSNHCEALAGAPAQGGFGGGRGRGQGGPGGAPGGQAPAQAGAAAGQPPAGAQGRRGGGRQMTPEQQAAMQARQEEMRKWRASTTPDTWKAVRKKWNDAGVDVHLLCYNMNDNMKDEDIVYGFEMAKALGVKAMTTSTTLTMAKRIAPIADKYKLMVGYHGHDQTDDPNQTATLESYDTLMAYGKYNGVNLDIGHFTAAGYDAVAFIKQHHDKITNLHIKDRKKNTDGGRGANLEFGQGDTPIKPVLQLMKSEKYPFPANIELEYRIPEGSNAVAEVKKCYAYIKDCLA